MAVDAIFPYFVVKLAIPLRSTIHPDHQDSRPIDSE
jgi:hypothetical protein